MRERTNETKHQEGIGTSKKKREQSNIKEDTDKRKTSTESYEMHAPRAL